MTNVLKIYSIESLIREEGGKKASPPNCKDKGR